MHTTVPYSLTRLGVVMTPQPGSPLEAVGVLNPGSGRTPTAGVEHPHGFKRVAGLGCHHDAQTGQGVRDGGVHGQADQPFTPEPSSDEVKCFWKAMKRATAGAARTTAPARIAP